MKRYKVETFILDSNMELIKNTKEIYDFGEYSSIEEAFKDLIGFVMSRTMMNKDINKDMNKDMNKDTHSLTFLDGVNMVKWILKEEI